MKKLLLICSAIALTYGDCVFAMERTSSGNCNCKSTLQDLQEQISQEKTRRTQAVQAIKVQLSEEKYRREQLENKVKSLEEQIQQIEQMRTEEAVNQKVGSSEFRGFALNRHKQSDFGELQSRRGVVSHSRLDNRYTELKGTEFKGEVVKDGSILRYYKAFPNLKKLEISDRDLEFLKESSLKFPKLEELTIFRLIDDNNFSSLMTLLSKAPNLEVLNIDKVRLSSENLAELRKFDGSASIDSDKVAADLGKLSLAGRTEGKKLLNIKTISLYQLKITKFVGEDQKKLKELSDEILREPKLEGLDLSGIGLKILPEEIFSLKNLRVLNLSGNELNNLPESIRNLKNLEELYVNGNTGLGALPDSIIHLKDLRVLGISDCYNISFWKQKLEKLQSANPNLKIITK